MNQFAEAICLAQADTENTHSLNVATFSLLISQQLNIDNKLGQDIYTAARLHDIGKKHISAKILNKPGILTNEEYEYVKSHVAYGAAEAFVAGHNSNVVRFIYYHHENYDGTGYPSGLKGEKIPIGARIIRIADFYDAMTNDRVYRPRYTHEETLKVMKANIKLFDENIFNAFLKIIKRKGVLK